MLKTLQKYTYLIYTFLYLVIPAYVVFNILGKPLTGTDDANIYLQYARNFTSGYGIVYNPGGEHVEGFSSTLYFLICSVFNFFTDTPEVCILLFNLIIAMLSCMLMLHTIKRISTRLNVPKVNIHLLYFVYLFWLFINPSFFCWTIITLMDSGLYTFLLILSYTFFIQMILKGEAGKKQKSIAWLVFIMIIARPEGLIWSTVYLFLYFLLVYHKEQNIKLSLRKMMIPLLTFILTLTALTLYRLWYFGYPLPNTYYTKVSASFVATLTDGFGYFTDFVKMYNGIILIISFLLGAWVIRSFFSKLRSELYFISVFTIVFILVGITLPIIEGGDHFKAFRFFQPVYPFLIMSFIILLFIFNRTGSFKMLMLHSISVSLLLFLGSHDAGWSNFYRNNNTFQVPEDVSFCIKMEFDITTYTRENGRRLNDFFKGNLPVIGFGAAGGIAIGYDGIVYDMLGLNLPELAHADAIKKGPKAHQSFNKKVFYKLAPDILMPTTELSSVQISLEKVEAYYCNTNKWDNLIYKNIFNDKEFRQKYTFALAVNSLQPDYVCYGYFNNNYLKKLAAKQNFKFLTLK